MDITPAYALLRLDTRNSSISILSAQTVVNPIAEQSLEARFGGLGITITERSPRYSISVPYRGNDI